MSTIYYPLWILLLAVILFVLEIFIPSGGILGVLSALAFIAAVVAAFVTGGLKLGTTFMACTAILIPALTYLLIKLWPKTPFGQRILIELPDPSSVLPDRQRQRQQLIGQRGVAVSPLLPAGAIRIQGRTLDAISDGMSIDKGTAIEVIAVRNNAIVVRPATAATATEGEPTAAENRPLDAVIPDPFDDTLS
jgi:membrane-bound ClpP family serine protease